MRKFVLLVFAPLILAAPANATPTPPNAVDPCQLGFPPDLTVRDSHGHLVPPLPCPVGVWTWGPRN